MAQKLQLLLVHLVSPLLRCLIRLKSGRLFGPRLLPTDSEITWSIYPEEPPNRIQDLLHRWRKADGGEVGEVADLLSRALVKTPRSFIEAMHEDKESFSKWLDTLQHVFTMFQAAGDELDDQLYYAYYREFYRRMRRALSIRHYLDRPDLAKTAKTARRHLSRVNIRRIV
ncbi:MAG: hypothetical protein OYK82_03140 [Gammaproteobacteria bacterium]|nr:hypothetical protein [Gammaproteobacteria bacterium]